MKLKQFFVDNKDKIKKLFQFLLCVFGILFYTISIFACGYNVKTALDVTNKKELVNRNEANRGSLGATGFGSIIIGETVSDIIDSEIKYIVNFSNIELFEYIQNDFLEFELEFETKTKLYLYKNYYQYVESSELNKTFSISFQIPLNDYYIGNKIHEISIGTSDFECEIKDIVLDDIETFVINIFYQISFDIYVDTLEGDVVFKNYYNYTIDTVFPVSVYDKSASEYVDLLSYLLEESTSRYIPNQLRYFNLYDVGYDLGFEEGKDVGYEEGKDVGFEEGKDVGYSNGFDVGFVEGKDVGYEEGFTDGKFENNAILKPFELMSKGVEPIILVLSSEIAPGISIGTIALIPLAVTMIVFLLKGLVL